MGVPLRDEMCDGGSASQLKCVIGIGDAQRWKQRERRTSVVVPFNCTVSSQPNH